MNQFTCILYSKLLQDIDKTKVIDSHATVGRLVENLRHLSEFLVYAEQYGETYFE